jgi:hypothetical protein
VPTFLTQDHLDLEVELASSSTAEAVGSARVLVVVPGAPGGEVRYVATLVDGRLTAQDLLDAGDAPDDVDVSVTTKYRDAKAALAGEVDPNAAFMSGRTKVAGATGPLLAYLAATSGEGYREVREQLAAATTFAD